eukprot:15334333-Ditylum_brightwellii.AAC.1
MPLDGLWKFASRHGISGCRHMKKLNLSQVIIVAKGYSNIEAAMVTTEVTDPRTSLLTHFVTLHFINVLFGEKIGLYQPIAAKYLTAISFKTS